jgi:hypothetical protein
VVSLDFEDVVFGKTSFCSGSWKVEKSGGGLSTKIGKIFFSFLINIQIKKTIFLNLAFTKKTIHLRQSATANDVSQKTTSSTLKSKDTALNNTNLFFSLQDKRLQHGEGC